MKTLLIILSVLGGVAAFVCLVALIWQLSGMKKFRWNKPLIIKLSAMGLALVLLITPLVILGRNAWTPDGTRVPMIDQKTHQSERFTVQGVTYENTGLKLYEVEKVGKPLFAYKVPATALGITNNFYREVQNHDDLPIVADIYGNMFSPEAFVEEVVYYYRDANNRHWIHNGVELDEALVAVMEEFTRFDLQGADRTVLALKKPSTATIDLLGTDGLAWLYSYEFIEYEGKVYYYIHSAYNEKGEALYTLVEMPKSIGLPLLYEQSLWR